MYWLITLEYPPSYGGGIGTYCYHNAQMLREQGWNVTVFIPSRHASDAKVSDDNGVRVVEFPIVNCRSFNIVGYDTAIAYEFGDIIKEYLEKEGVPVVLESQEYAGIAYYILQYKHLGYPLFEDLKVLLTIHAPSFLYHDYNKVPPYQLPYFWIGEMERWCIKAADCINSPGHFIKEAIRPYFSTPLDKTIHVVPYPYRASIPDIDRTKDPRNNWFFFGKLTPQKGIFPLLDAYSKLLQEGWNKELKVIGGGNHYYHPEGVSVGHWIRKKYRAEIENKKLQLLGNLPPDEWNRVTAEGCVVIIPSIGDNYPFTVLESMTNGQIVLSSVQGGQSEIIRHGINGFLFDHTIEDDLENKIKEIAAMSLEKIQEIRQNAIISVLEKHKYEKVYPQKYELLKELHSQAVHSPVFPFTREIAYSKISGEQSQAVTRGLLSIVIPFYNMGNYIEETLASVSSSTYPRKEIIVVDDGSDEENAGVLERLKTKYSFTIIRQSNKGLSTARNIGAKNARGEFLAFTDADDKVDPLYYSKAVAVLQKKTNVSFAGSWVQYFERSNGIWPAFTPEPPYILYYNMVCAGGLVYKTEAFCSFGWNDKELKYGLEDWDSVISLVGNGRRGVVIPEPLYHYRIRKNSMARRFTKGKLLFSTRYISEKHAALYSTFAADLSNLYNANGPGFKIDNPSLDYNSYGLLPEGFPLLKKAVKLAKRTPLLRKLVFKIHSIIKK